VVRGPNEWPAAQRALHEAIDDGAAVPRRPVRLVWWRVHETWAAVYGTDGDLDEPLAVFPVGDQLEGDGTAPAHLLGEVGMNAACAVELGDGRRVWPRYNPVTGRWAPRPEAPALRTTRHLPPPGRWAVALLAVGVVGAGAVIQHMGAPDNGVAPAALRVVAAAGVVVIPVAAARRRFRRR